MLLHCNGVMDEMAAVADAARPLAGLAARRAKAALTRIAHAPEPLDRAALADDIARLTGS
jgi:beta-N-acetylhexosaminidase